MRLKSIPFLVLGAILLCAQPCFSFDDSASDLLKRALYFANLYNWRAATPLFQQSEQLARQAGDRRTALYAHLGTLRRDVSSSIAERSQQVADLLSTDPLLTADTDLRLFALSIKGDLDGEIDQSAAREDWTAVMSVANKLNDTTWVYRAEGQLGFADYYDGDLKSSQRRVTSALIAATKAGDIGAQIFFVSTIAHGYLNQHLLLPVAIDYAQKAVALAVANPRRRFTSACQFGPGRSSRRERECLSSKTATEQAPSGSKLGTAGTLQLFVGGRPSLAGCQAIRRRHSILRTSHC
jgi:hypothetical protein